MKNSLLLLLLLICGVASAQNQKLDSLNALLPKLSSDTAQINLMNTIGREMQNINLDSSIAFLKVVITKAADIHYKKGEGNARRQLGVGMAFKSNFSGAKKQFDIAEQLLLPLADSFDIGKLFSTYGVYYGLQSKYDSSNIYLKKSLTYLEHFPDKTAANVVYQNMAINYQMQSDFRQALFYQNKALQNALETNDYNAAAYNYLNMSMVYNNMNDYPKTEELLLKAVENAKKAGIKNVEQYAYSNLSSLYDNLKDYKKSYDYAMKTVVLGKITGDQAITSTGLSHAATSLAYENKFDEAEKLSLQAIALADSSGQPLNIFQTLKNEGFIKKSQKKYSEAIPFYEKAFAALKDADIYSSEIGNAHVDLSDCYEQTGDYKKALADLKIGSQISDSIKSRDNVRKATELSMNYDFQQKEQVAKAEQDKLNAIAKTKQTALLTGLLLTLIIIGIIIYAYRNKQKANTRLQTQKDELQITLDKLKSTQTQLIQSEKMASLGELTAGIAHEIQNPLNFVNNFSEVSSELIEEMQGELHVGNNGEAITLSGEVKQNLEKITHHGKRADSIVKGMLLHSRKSGGQKEATNINALCDEYLRLSYYGYRAKDKSFNATTQTDFDKSISEINIIPQDIARVLLNLFTNAFYAVNEKKKTAEENYQPTVFVSTKNLYNKIVITIRDNGNGIPHHIIDKIFQPFFTTKPTGQGTGLGLSLSYDIITQQHNGTIHVESKEGDGTTFIINLPV